MSMSIEQTQANEKLAMLVMLLIQMLFSQKDDDKDEKDPFVGLAAMMLLSTLGGGSERMSYIESNTSQVAYSSTTTSVSAVQASAYGQGAAPSGLSMTALPVCRRAAGFSPRGRALPKAHDWAIHTQS